MHFSRPSGQRLSWWCPWYLGAVGRFSSGYMTVSTFLNISRKVTPNPLTGLRKLVIGTGDLLLARVSGTTVVSGTTADELSSGQVVSQLKAVIVRQVERRHREPRLDPGFLLDQCLRLW